MDFQYTGAICTIAAVNFEKLVDFYTRLINQEPSLMIPHIYAEFILPGVKLGIFRPQTTDTVEFAHSVNSQMSLCLQVNNLEQALSHLTNLGYPPPGKISIASHGKEIYAYDPDGNRLILHQPTSVR